jgi:hypothetical protein
MSAKNRFLFILTLAVVFTSGVVVALSIDEYIDNQPKEEALNGQFIKKIQVERGPYISYKKLCVDGTVVYTAASNEGYTVLRRGGKCSSD